MMKKKSEVMETIELGGDVAFALKTLGLCWLSNEIMLRATG